jgi:large subunit ribosomal protein L21
VEPVSSGATRQREVSAVYAIIRAGGRQEKVAVDDVLTVDKLTGDVGSTIKLAPVLVVDGDNVVSAAAELAKYEITAEILGAVKGPKIKIMHYRNKTGYKRRMGHRQPYTQVKVTGIKAGK